MNRFFLLFSILLLASCTRKTSDEQFAEAARQETQQMCPRVIDSTTTLDSIVYDIPTRTEQFFYTFSENMDDSTIFTPYFVEDLREEMVKRLRNEIKLKRMMDEGINFAYIYHSATTGQPLLDLLFTHDDYTGPLQLRTFNKRTTDKWADYTRKHCPEEQDECTMLDSIAFDSLTSVLHYDFSLSGQLDLEDFNEVYPDAKKELRKLLAEGIRDNDMLRDERKEGISYTIRYTSSSTGRLILEIKINGQSL